MNHRLHLLGSLLILSSMTLGSSTAVAQQKRAVILSAQLNGYFPMRKTLPAEIELAFADRLRGMRYTVTKVALSPKDLTCWDDECLAALVAKHGVDLVVSARLINDEQAVNAYHGAVRIALAGPPAETRTREKECPNCAIASVRDMLVVALGEAVGNLPTETKTNPDKPPHVDRPPSTVNGKQKLPTDPPLPALVTPPSINPKWRPLLYTVGAVGIAGMVASVIGLAVKAVQFHDPSCTQIPNSRGCNFVLNTLPGIAGSAAGLVVSAVLTGVGFGLAPKTYPQTHLTLSPLVGPASGALISGTF